MEAWACRAYVGDSMEEMAVMNANALGGVAVIDGLVETIEGLRVDGSEQL